jgi:carbon-monoxide dehydrogenase small subunit
MLLTAAELLRQNPAPTREEIREHLSGNYCRCTGYHAIVDAVAAAAARRQSGVDGRASEKEAITTADARPPTADRLER